MKDFYTIFNINYRSSLVSICYAYQKKCLENPSLIFFYTKILKVLTNPQYKIWYDSMLLQIDFRFFLYQPTFTLDEDDEYELALIISWMEDFREYVYDTKYIIQDSYYLTCLEEWYNELENILFYLKSCIQNFTLI